MADPPRPRHRPSRYPGAGLQDADRIGDDAVAAEPQDGGGVPGRRCSSICSIPHPTARIVGVSSNEPVDGADDGAHAAGLGDHRAPDASTFGRSDREPAPAASTRSRSRAGMPPATPPGRRFRSACPWSGSGSPLPLPASAQTTFSRNSRLARAFAIVSWSVAPTAVPSTMIGPLEPERFQLREESGGSDLAGPELDHHLVAAGIRVRGTEGRRAHPGRSVRAGRLSRRRVAKSRAVFVDQLARPVGFARPSGRGGRP